LKYTVLLEQGVDGGWGAYVPDMPGCFSSADTYEEILSTVQEAIAGHIRMLEESGEEVPSPRTIAGTVEIQRSA
jgi:predicted RNase H-like HicB family nuclease